MRIFDLWTVNPHNRRYNDNMELSSIENHWLESIIMSLCSILAYEMWIIAYTFAYRALFIGQSLLPGGKDPLEGASAGEGPFQFFGYLALHGRCWTSNRLRQRGLRDRDEGTLCAQEVRMLDHLLASFVFRHETWFHVLRHIGLGNLAPTEDLPLVEWWTRVRKVDYQDTKEGFWSSNLAGRYIWKERNRRVHDRPALMPVASAPAIM